MTLAQDILLESAIGEGTYQVSNTFNKSMFAMVSLANNDSNPGVWKDWGTTTIATYQGTPMTGARAYPFETNPASPSTSSPWHNIIYENCIGPYNWGARAFWLNFPFGAFNETFFLTPEIWKRTFTETNANANNHDQPAIWKGFKYAVKALIEGTLTPTGKTAMTEPCNVMIYHPSNRGYLQYREQSNDFWNSLTGTTDAKKDQEFYEYLDAWIADLIFIKSNISGAGKLYITLDAVSPSATPSNISHWRSMPDYRTDALELSDWYIFNRLIAAGIAVFYESRSEVTRNKAIAYDGGGSGTAGETLPVDWAGKAFSAEEYWFWYSNPTHPTVNIPFANHASDESTTMVFRILGANWPPPIERDPYGVTRTVTFNGQTKTLNYNDINIYTPQYAMWSYYMLSDHYRKYYNKNTSTNTFTGISATVENITSYFTDMISSTDLCISVFDGIQDPFLKYHSLPGAAVNYRPPFEPGTGSGQWNGPRGYLLYNQGLWTQHGKNIWDENIRANSFNNFISKLHNYSLTVGPKYNWFGTKYGSLADTLTRNVIDLVAPARVFTDFWASSWFSTDPLVAVNTQEPVALGNVNSHSLVKPMIHVYDCVADGGYNDADGNPISNSLSNFLNASSGCGNRIDAIKTKLMEMPKGKRVLKMTRYDQGNYYSNSYDAYPYNGPQVAIGDDVNPVHGPPSPWADNEGVIVKNDVKLVSQALYAAGSRPSHIILDSPPSESNVFQFFRDNIDTYHVNKIVNDPRAKRVWNGSKSFNDLYQYKGEGVTSYTLDFANIRTPPHSSHPQSNRRYLYWDRACNSIQNQFLNAFIVNPLVEIFGNTIKICNYESVILKEDTFVYDIYGHPYMLENLVGDATSPAIYGGWGMSPGTYGVWNTDPTKIVRTDWANANNNANGGTTEFFNTVWNQFLMNIQKLRGTKRASPNNPMRPWIAPLRWVGSGDSVPLWNTDGGADGVTLTQAQNLYWEQIKHALLTGSDSLMYFNQNDSIVDRTKLNTVLTNMNTTTGGYTPHSTNTARISFLAIYVISGAPIGAEGSNYIWRVTPKPGVTLLNSENIPVTTSSNGGFWVTTTTEVPPVFH